MTLVRHILNRPSRRGTRRAGFSLLETTVAISVLGIGLIMVAAMFPIALTQHRMSVDRDRAHNAAVAAESLLRNTIDADQLYGFTSTQDSDWYLIPSPNLPLGANDLTPNASNWDYMPHAPDDYFYANTISGFSGGYGNLSTANTLQVMDVLNERVAPFTTNHPGSPFTDTELLDESQSMVWYGFYRKLATGGVEYAAAVCKRRRNQIFAAQDLSDPTSTKFFSPIASGIYRLPVPWRITVTCWPGENALWKVTTGLPLASIAPVGTKLIVQGTIRTGDDVVVTPRPVPAGKVLVVSDIVNDNVVEVMGDLSELPAYNAADSTTAIWFDVWVFPPAVEGNGFDKHSPLIEWKLHL